MWHTEPHQDPLQFWCVDTVHDQSLYLPGPKRSNPHNLVQVGYSWHLANETKINVSSSNEALRSSGVSKVINLTSNHHTRITRFNTNHQFGVDNAIGWIHHGKAPYPAYRYDGGIGWLSAQHQECVCPTI